MIPQFAPTRSGDVVRRAEEFERAMQVKQTGMNIHDFVPQ
jgi:hypothetical protein